MVENKQTNESGLIKKPNLPMNNQKSLGANASWMQEFDKRRLYAWERLNAMPGIRCEKPQGAFYLFPSIADTGLDSNTFCDRLLEKHNVAAVAGIGFGSDAYLRLSYATSMENIEKGLDRMETFVKSL